MLIGLSVSQCVRDIATGKVDERYVAYIIGGTAHEDEEAFKEACVRYGDGAWRDCAPEAITVAARLYTQGRIWQPRLGGGPILSTAEGPWLKANHTSAYRGDVWTTGAPEFYSWD